MLNEHNVAHTYRDYTQEPLSQAELRDVLAKLGLGPRDVLRSRDAKKAGLTGSETDDELIAQMAENPRLLQRPIGIVGDRAALGRPPKDLLALIEP
ncbi:MAG TPA: arsenate reductase (glutaredoxin) [Deltaproteobacteria bacterium]|nr:arsenate reductase (glutaredoxin) [Deltaproteobacteria bacterium]